MLSIRLGFVSLCAGLMVTPAVSNAQTADCNWLLRNLAANEGTTQVVEQCPQVTLNIPGVGQFQTPASCPSSKTTRRPALFLCNAPAANIGKHCKFDGEKSYTTTWENANPCPSISLPDAPAELSLTAFVAFLRALQQEMQGAAFCGNLQQVGEPRFDWSAFIIDCPTGTAHLAPAGHGEPGGTPGDAFTYWEGDFSGVVPGPAQPSALYAAMQGMLRDDSELPVTLSSVKLDSVPTMRHIVATYEQAWPNSPGTVPEKYTISGAMTSNGTFDLRASGLVTGEGETVLATRVATFDGATLVIGYEGASTLSVYASDSSKRDSEMQVFASYAQSIWFWVRNPDRIGAVADAEYDLESVGDDTVVTMSAPHLNPAWEHWSVSYRISEVASENVVTRVELRDPSGRLSRRLELANHTKFDNHVRPTSVVETTYDASETPWSVQTLNFIAASPSEEALEINWPRSTSGFYTLRSGG